VSHLRKSKIENRGSKIAFFHLAILSVLCGFGFFFPLAGIPFYTEGEARKALAVLDVVAGGDWLFSSAIADGSSSRLFYWVAWLASLAFGQVNEPAVRFPSALFASLGVLALYLSGRKLYDSHVAFLGSVILATSLGYPSLAITANVHMTACFLMIACLTVFYLLYLDCLKGFWWYAFYLFFGATILAGGLSTFIVSGTIIGAFLIFAKRRDFLGRLCFQRGVILTIGIVGFHYAAAFVTGGEDFIRGGPSAQLFDQLHPRILYYYFPKYLLLVGFPWSLFWPGVIIACMRHPFSRDDHCLFFMVWALVTLVFFSFSPVKQLASLLALTPPLALLTARWSQEGAMGSAAAQRVLAGFFALFSAAFATLFMGALGGSDPAWVFSTVFSIVKPEHHGIVLLLKNSIREARWLFLIFSGLSVIIGVFLGRDLFRGRLGRVPLMLALFFLTGWSFAQSTIVPVVAHERSYGSFVKEVKKLLTEGSELYLWDGRVDNSQLFFYYGGRIQVLNEVQVLVTKLRSPDAYVIMREDDWRAIHAGDKRLPAPVLQSGGGGVGFEKRRVLIRGQPDTDREGW
jgi:4-amino-4-deoxy-L-arabinose transferase-like glycosyltransferase